jgi:NTE family protein
MIRGTGNGMPRVAIVLSGGGARGAYEAGVLRYLLDLLPERLGRPVRFDIVTGTSVGAIHACYVAAAAGTPGAGRVLTELWESLSIESVYSLGIGDVLGAPFKLLGLGAPAHLLPANGALAPERLPGLLNTERLEGIIFTRIAWENIGRRIESGELTALAVAATEIATGRTVVFVDNHHGEVSRWAHDPFVEARAARIGPLHALASAAIPLVFPAVRVDHAYYCDGGLRLNTPLAPALRLGAERVLVVGLRHQPVNGEAEHARAHYREAHYNSPTYLAGKVLNALLLDHVDYDVDRLRLFNAILESGAAAYGPGFLDRINEPIVARRGMPYRTVRDLFIRPSRDIGAIAFECARHRERPAGVRGLLSDLVVRYAAQGSVGEADLLSYVLFDRCYATHLIELGMADAAARADEIVEFFGG